MTAPRLLSVLVINYNGAAFLPACLAALDRQTMPRERYEIVLVDNASTDDSADEAAKRFTRVKSLRSSVNVGFAEGNNVAARHARGSVLVLLNSDTLPDPHWLAEVDRAVTEHPGCAIACKLVLAGAPDRVNSGGLYLLRDGRGADRGFRAADDGSYERGGDVFAGCAAALAVPRPPNGEPLFDSRYFLYSEDLELGWRRQRRGSRTVYAPRAVVRHAVGGSGGESPVYWFHAERNRALTAVRHGDAVLAVASAVGLTLRAARAVVLAAARHPAAKYRWPNALAVARAWVSFVRTLPSVLSERHRAPRAEADRCGW